MSFSPVIKVRKFIDKIKSERSSPRLKRFPSRTLSEEAKDQITVDSSLQIPPYKQRKPSSSVVQYTGDNNFDQIPVEATFFILSFLDAKDLCRMAQVSKEMRFFADDELLWKEISIFDWGISEAFASTWKLSYALLEDLCADGIWEGTSKWIEPAGFDNDQKTTARLHFVKRSKSQSTVMPSRASLTAIHRVDSQNITPPITKTDSAVALPNHQTAPYRIIGSGVTVNCTTPSPFKIEGQRTIKDPTGCTFEWNKVFEKHTSIYSGQMNYATRTVEGTIAYNDGTTEWKGAFSYTKTRGRAVKLVLA